MLAEFTPPPTAVEIAEFAPAVEIPSARTAGARVCRGRFRPREGAGTALGRL
jgi:hypothetical protein